MSIQSEINRISQNVSDSLDAVEAKGVTIPSGSNSNDLPDLISAIEQIDVSEDTATPDVVADGYTFHLANGQRSTGTAKYAASPVVNGPATVTNAIHYAAVDSTSTSTKFTATVSDVTALYDGLTIMLYNGVVTSAANYTININNLGAYGTYNNMALGNSITPTNATRDTTIFNINYAMLMVFCTTIHGVGSGWICYRGYDANTNTIGYQIRTNSFSLPMTSVVYRYRLLFQSADNNHWVPATNSTSTNATSARTPCQDPINPLGAIVYYGTTSSVAAGSRPSAANLWQQYTLNLGYSFQKSTNYSLTSWKPVYLKCTLQSNGSAIINSNDPVVQDLPSSDDGNLYILLGYAYNATSIELVYYHPVYYYKDGTLRTWTGVNVPTKTSQLTNDSGFITSANIPSPSDATPQALGTASAGSSANYSRADHVHTKPTYSKSDVGLGNVDNVKQYSASNPPPYPVTSVNGKTGAVTVSELPTVTSSDNGKILKVVNGAWAAATLNVYNGGVS